MSWQRKKRKPSPVVSKNEEDSYVISYLIKKEKREIEKKCPVHVRPTYVISGNLGRVDFTSEFEYDLFIRPDTCSPRHRLWFNFVIDNTRLDQRVILNIVNMGKTKNLFRDGMTPLVRSTSRNKKW